MSMNNGVLIQRREEKGMFGRTYTFYDLYYIPCMDKDEKVMIDSFLELDAAIRRANMQDFEYGIMFAGF